MQAKKRKIIMTSRKFEVNLCPHGYNTNSDLCVRDSLLPHNRAALCAPIRVLIALSHFNLLPSPARLMITSAKQYSPACERNQSFILPHLQSHLSTAKHVLEIGSGTGQHAIFFSQNLPHLIWQTSDRAENHPSIHAWIDEHHNPQVRRPIELDVGQSEWPSILIDAAFTANTCHIMHIDEVAMMFAGVSRLLSDGGLMVIYGPFNYAGQFTSASNQEFDMALKLQAAHRGIRHIEDIQSMAIQHRLTLTHDHAMPANNRLLVFRKST